MKEYIKKQLAKLKPGMPGDDKMSAIHSIYDALESKGYSTKQVKNLIDEVIFENLDFLKNKLNFQLEMLKPNEKDNV